MMFSSPMTADQFLDAIQRLAIATEGVKPAALHNGVKRILNSCDGFEGKKVDDLIKYIAAGKKKKSGSSVGRKAAVKSSAKVEHSEKVVSDIVKTLNSLEQDEAKFNSYFADQSKKCNAKTIKQVAANYAASTVPKTKAAAIDLVIRARGNKLRANLKLKESGESTPW